MPTKDKIRQVEELKERLDKCTIAVATDFTGMSVNDFTELRRVLREKGGDLRVVKNNLVYIAADLAGKSELKEVVNGPCALTFGYDDPVEVAKALIDYIKSNRSVLEVRGASMDGQVLSSGQVSMLAEMPPKIQIVAQLLRQLQSPVSSVMAQLQAPLSQLVNLLNGPIRGLVVVLNQKAQQMETKN